jgi:biopolymer transport protein ExbD
MKIRGGTRAEKIEPQMAPMIDIVFQLLIFFMLTLKIIEPEGDFNINMPIGAPPTQPPDDVIVPDLKVRLEANPDGSLRQVSLTGRRLGNDPQVYDRLNQEILKIIVRPNNPLMKDVEVEVDADYHLHYRHIISAVSACTGRLDPGSGQIVRYIEKVKFAKPRRPGEG